MILIFLEYPQMHTINLIFFIYLLLYFIHFTFFYFHFHFIEEREEQKESFSFSYLCYICIFLLLCILQKKKLFYFLLIPFANLVDCYHYFIYSLCCYINCVGDFKLGVLVCLEVCYNLFYETG